MGRDYTKYQVVGMDGIFGKGKLVLAVVQDYCSKNECTFDELKQVFPDDLQGGITGVFGYFQEAKEIAKKRARHYVKHPITIKDATIAVSTQWGTQIGDFILKAVEIGYVIHVAGENENPSDSSNNFEESNSTSEKEVPAEVEKNELELLEEKLIKGSEPWVVGNDNETYGHYFAFILMSFAYNSDEIGIGEEEMDAIHSFMTKIWGVGNQISEEKYDDRMAAVAQWYNAVKPDGVYDWIEYGIAIFRNSGDLTSRLNNDLLTFMFTVACANSKLTDDEKWWLSYVADCLKWNISDELKNDLRKIGIVQNGESENPSLIIFGNDMVEKEHNRWNTKIELWVGEFNESPFILVRIYSDPYVEDEEVYYNSFEWEYYEDSPLDDNDDIIEITKIVDLISHLTYEYKPNKGEWERALALVKN